MNLSAIELINLIKGHLSDILLRESGNLLHIYLYHTGDYWVAFERSAFHLCHVYTHSDVMAMQAANVVPFPFVMANVRDKELLSVTRSLRCLKRNEEQRVYEVEPFSYTDVSFRKWHSRKVNESLVLFG